MPETCSQCLGLATKKVVVAGSVITVDGEVVVRENDQQSTSFGRRNARRKLKAKPAP